MRIPESVPPISPLTRLTAEQHAGVLVALALEIPHMIYDESILLADEDCPKGKALSTKWHYSLVMGEGEPTGTAIGYERFSDHSKNYPENSIHLEVLALLPACRGQGLGRTLLGTFLKNSIEKYAQDGFMQIAGPLQFSLATSNMPRNNHVKRLYASFGFEPKAYRLIDGLPYVGMWATAKQVQRHLDI